MGMFDYIVIDEQVRDKLGIPNVQYQTKSMHQNLDTYLLKFRKDGLFAKLYILDPPLEEQWYEYSEEEKRHLKALFPELPSFPAPDGYWEEGAWDTENRYTRDMGEIPNGILELRPDKGATVHENLCLTFSDGLLKCVEVIPQ